MSAVNLKVSGGGRMKRYLSGMDQALGTASAVRVGFLEHATYPATPATPPLHVAQVAFWNEFGTSRAPARPFFRGMIRKDLHDWADRFARYLQSANYNSNRAFALLGIETKDNLTSAIWAWPADNAPSTVARKGFDHGLIESGVMQRSTDYEVVN